MNPLEQLQYDALKASFRKAAIESDLRLEEQRLKTEKALVELESAKRMAELQERHMLGIIKAQGLPDIKPPPVGGAS
jgi:hypothetical protein